MELFLTPLINFINKPDYDQIQRVNGLDEHRSLISDSQLKRILLAAGCDKKALANKSYRSHIVSATLTFSDQAFRHKYTQWIFSRYSKSAEEDQQIWRNESNVLVNWAQQFNSSRSSNLKVISIRPLINYSTFKAQIKLIGFIPRDHKSKDSRFSFDFTKALKANFRNQSAAQAYYLFEIYEGHNLARVMQRLFRSIIPEAQIRCISVKPGYQTVLKLIPRKHKNDKGRMPKRRSSKSSSNQDSHQSSRSAVTSKSATATSVASHSISASSSESLSRMAKSRSVVTSSISSSAVSSHHSAEYPVKRSTKSLSNSSSTESSGSQIQQSSNSSSSSSTSSRLVTSGQFKLTQVSSVSSVSHRSNKGHKTKRSRSVAAVASKAVDHERNAKSSRTSAANHRAATMFNAWIKSLSTAIKWNQNHLHRLTSQAKQCREEARKVIQKSTNGFKSDQPIQIVSSGLMLLNSHVQKLSKALHDNLDVISQLSVQYADQIHSSHHKNKKHKSHKTHHKWLHKFKL